jgi:hypothetical protein
MHPFTVAGPRRILTGFPNTSSNGGTLFLTQEKVNKRKSPLIKAGFGGARRRGQTLFIFRFLAATQKPLVFFELKATQPKKLARRRPVQLTEDA